MGNSNSSSYDVMVTMQKRGTIRHWSFGQRAVQAVRTLTDGKKIKKKKILIKKIKKKEKAIAAIIRPVFIYLYTISYSVTCR